MKRRSRTYLSVIIISGILLVIALFVIFTPEPPEKDVTPDWAIDTSNWKTYTNKHYGFSLKYPPEWIVNEDPANPDAPVYNIFKPGGEKLKLPYDHHTDGVTHVSIFPEGVSSEGVFGVSRESEINFELPAIEVLDYILEDGTPWATIATFSDPPPKWSKSGFLFSSVNIQNLDAKCLREGENISDEECEPLLGDTVIRKGEIDEQERLVTIAIMESFEFISEDRIADNSYRDMIRINNPVPGTKVSSPLYIEGEARGPWYFEGSFVVVLTDWDGRIISEGIAKAKGDWMTIDYVPFYVTLKFDVDTRVSNRGSLIFRKENPSGLPENEDAFEFFVFFEKDNGRSFDGDISLAKFYENHTGNKY